MVFLSNAIVTSFFTGRQTTSWIDYSSYTTGVYKDVDISKCGFTKIPTITTAIEGSGNHKEITGTSAVYGATTTTFRIYIGTGNANNSRKDYAQDNKWNVDWIAVGFTC